MSERSDDILIKDIYESIVRIQRYTNELDADAFIKDEKTQDAIARNFEIIGEAAARLSPLFKTTFSFVNWRLVKDFRNKLIHAYFGIDLQTVWLIVQNHLPQLRIDMERIIKELESGNQ